MNDNPQTLITEYRVANNWKQKQLATMLNCSTSQIHKHEAELSSPNIIWLRRYAKALNIYPSDLLINKDRRDNFEPEEIVFIGKWQKLTDHQKNSIIDLMNSMSKDN